MAEAAEVKVGHVSIDDSGKKVSLTIPKSKTDQSASGTSRSLGCCGMPACHRGCPVALAMRALADRPNAAAEDPLFPDCDGNRVSKLQLVTAWTRHIDKNMSGHSARRSGAMMYTRMGIDVQTVAFMGRWKSSAVFRYVEEAMTEMPLNQRATLSTEARSNMTSETATKSPEVIPDSLQPPDVATQAASETPGESKILWAVSRARDREIIHKVKEASWNIQLNEWKTVCGWHFARHNVKVELTRIPPKAAAICAKCNKLGEMRDEVKAAREWAHLINLG